MNAQKLTIIDNGDGAITVDRNGSYTCVLFKHGGGGVESLAYEMAEMLSQAPAPAPEPLHLGACLTDGKLHATVMRREPNGHITVLAMAEIDEAMLRAHDCHAVMVPAASSPAVGAEPLTESQMRLERQRLDPMAEDMDAWSFEQGVRFAERAHSIGLKPPVQSAEGA